ncbi:MAG: hypothetical protein JKY37_14955, partial [Nannocystaceae bacterium]|nr:hypothetical protein [Nannocystaceae bacterium]
MRVASLRGPLRGRVVGVLFALLVCVAPSVAAADAVDDAFAKGNAAAAHKDWPAAVQSYQRATSLARRPSATLSFNLGTAYLRVGDLGRATYHLRRAV